MTQASDYYTKHNDPSHAQTLIDQLTGDHVDENGVTELYEGEGSPWIFSFEDGSEIEVITLAKEGFGFKLHANLYNDAQPFGSGS